MKGMKYYINVYLVLFITILYNYSIKSYQFLNCILKVVTHRLKFVYRIKITRKIYYT
jgi:hypothetical protein